MWYLYKNTNPKQPNAVIPVQDYTILNATTSNRPNLNGSFNLPKWKILNVPTVRHENVIGGHPMAGVRNTSLESLFQDEGEQENVRNTNMHHQQKTEE